MATPPACSAGTPRLDQPAPTTCRRSTWPWCHRRRLASGLAAGCLGNAWFNALCRDWAPAPALRCGLMGPGRRSCSSTRPVTWPRRTRELWSRGSAAPPAFRRYGDVAYVDDTIAGCLRDGTLPERAEGNRSNFQSEGAAGSGASAERGPRRPGWLPAADRSLARYAPAGGSPSRTASGFSRERRRQPASGRRVIGRLR